MRDIVASFDMSEPIPRGTAMSLLHTLSTMIDAEQCQNGALEGGGNRYEMLGADVLMRSRRS